MCSTEDIDLPATIALVLAHAQTLSVRPQEHPNAQQPSPRILVREKSTEADGQLTPPLKISSTPLNAWNSAPVMPDEAEPLLMVPQRQAEASKPSTKNTESGSGVPQSKRAPLGWLGRKRAEPSVPGEVPVLRLPPLAVSRRVRFLCALAARGARARNPSSAGRRHCNG